MSRRPSELPPSSPKVMKFEYIGYRNEARVLELTARERNKHSETLKLYFTEKSVHDDKSTIVPKSRITVTDTSQSHHSYTHYVFDESRKYAERVAFLEATREEVGTAKQSLHLYIPPNPYLTSEILLSLVPWIFNKNIIVNVWMKPGEDHQLKEFFKTIFGRAFLFPLHNADASRIFDDEHMALVERQDRVITAIAAGGERELCRFELRNRDALTAATKHLPASLCTEVVNDCFKQLGNTLSKVNFEGVTREQADAILRILLLDDKKHQPLLKQLNLKVPSMVSRAHLQDLLDIRPEKFQPVPDIDPNSPPTVATDKQVATKSKNEFLPIYSRQKAEQRDESVRWDIVYLIHQASPAIQFEVLTFLRLIQREKLGANSSSQLLVLYELPRFYPRFNKPLSKIQEDDNPASYFFGRPEYYENSVYKIPPHIKDAFVGSEETVFKTSFTSERQHVISALTKPFTTALADNILRDYKYIDTFSHRLNIIFDATAVMLLQRHYEIWKFWIPLIREGKFIDSEEGKRTSKVEEFLRKSIKIALGDKACADLYPEMRDLFNDAVKNPNNDAHFDRRSPSTQDLYEKLSQVFNAEFVAVEKETDPFLEELIKRQGQRKGTEPPPGQDPKRDVPLRPPARRMDREEGDSKAYAGSQAPSLSVKVPAGGFYGGNGSDDDEARNLDDDVRNRARAPSPRSSEEEV